MTLLEKDYDIARTGHAPRSEPTYFSASGLEAYYGESYIVQGVSFNIHEGEILMEMEPPRAIDSLRGRIWRRTVSREELPSVEAELPVIATKLLAGRTIVHVHAEEAPGPGYEPFEPDLKDVYFSVMGGHA